VYRHGSLERVSLNAWVAQTGTSPMPAEISRDGVFKNARPSDDGLSLMVDYKGVSCTGMITRPSNLSEDSFILLRHILLQHHDQPMEAVENIDIDFTLLH
jgi:hypothetical protein